MPTEKIYKVIGIMSGTSLDGVDIAYCEFRLKSKQWSYKIIDVQTIPYNHHWQNLLKKAATLSGSDIIKLDKEYGTYLGQLVLHFIHKTKLKPNFIGSHGHTIFHQPQKGYTFQLGDGSYIAAATGIKTICNFRNQDVALGGNGAPLVPIGDEFLFKEFDYCLNLGGFSNISYNFENKRVAYDICPVNTVLNDLSFQLGFEYDQNGQFASEGRVDISVLKALDNLEYYSAKPPKSLGREWLKSKFYPIINASQSSVKDKLRTVCEHIGTQISENISRVGTIFITGGGTYNQFLLKQIQEKTSGEIVIPDNKLIDYKEAMLFAFLAVLRFRDEVNCLSTVTGAKHDHSSGVIFEAK